MRLCVLHCPGAGMQGYLESVTWGRPDFGSDVTAIGVFVSKLVLEVTSPGGRYVPIGCQCHNTGACVCVAPGAGSGGVCKMGWAGGGVWGCWVS